MMLFMATSTVKNEVEGNNKTNRQKIFSTHERTILSIFFFAFAFLVLLLPEVLGKDIFKSIDPDGVASLFLLSAVILFLKLDRDIRKTLKTPYKSLGNGIIIIFFMIAGIIALWFTIRTFGLIIRQSLFLIPDSDFNYTTSQIFFLLGYLLAANLCFSLAKTFQEIEVKKDPIIKLLGAVIQAIIIGMITFIPRYADNSLVGVIGNGNASIGEILYVIVLVTFVGSLLLLIRFRNHEFKREDYEQN
jgi:hypothetical protein